ncbi:exopolysaccharide biosynthesis protein [Caulobacter sp. FWC2]|nr:sugar transferase [Caulobacter sp. FWC2]PIB94241.1 exopolysaccharide biosynthesis protein [Caulobacter sp. FWC2]
MDGGSYTGRISPKLHDPLPKVATDPYKRAFDIVSSGLLLLLFAPLLLLAALLIKLESPGPALFRQMRGGLGGAKFQILKLRTMRCREDGPELIQAQRGDDRVTRIGRLLRASSIDELPQLLNVLRGDMSLVGPRPHAAAHDDYYGTHIPDYHARYQARPGLTGWAQVKGLRGGTDTVDAMRKRVEADIDYIRTWSILKDAQIVLLTIPSLLIAENAY